MAENSSNADDNALLWIGLSQSRFDFWGDGRAKFTPDGITAGFSYLFSENFEASYSYSDSDAEQSWLIAENDFRELRDDAQTESESHSISGTWYLDNFSLTLSSFDVDSEERALIRFPVIAEITRTKDRVTIFSYDDFKSFNDKTLGWRIGLQYANSKNDNLQIYFVEPVTSVATRFNQTSYSILADLDWSVDYTFESLTLTPKIAAGWSFEISSDGEPLILVTRGDQRMFFNQFNDRFLSNFRTPDTGFWELSTNIDFHNGWSTSIGLSRTLSAPVETTYLAWDLSVSF